MPPRDVRAGGNARRGARVYSVRARVGCLPGAAATVNLKGSAAAPPGAAASAPGRARGHGALAAGRRPGLTGHWPRQAGLSERLDSEAASGLP